MDYIPSTVLIAPKGFIIVKLLHVKELDDKLKHVLGF